MYTTAEQRQLQALHSMSAPPAPYNRQQASGMLQQAGNDWQDEKVQELQGAFDGPELQVLIKPPVKGAPVVFPMTEAILILKPGQFVIEAEYQIPASFEQAHGLSVLNDEYDLPLTMNAKGKPGVVRPDAVQALPPLQQVTPEDQLQEPPGANQAVDLQGHLTTLLGDDPRIRLRVIDIKLSSQPGAQYFAETVYYSMTLAAWLEAHGYADRFVVVACAAVWPGNYKGSNLSIAVAKQHSVDARLQAFEKDLEVSTFEVYVPTLVKLLREELPTVLSRKWQELPWHTSVRCQTCEFFGYRFLDRNGTPLVDPPDHRHCYEQAQGEDRVKRIAGLTRGTAARLETRASTVQAFVKVLPGDAIFKGHRALALNRNVLLRRASSLDQQRLTPGNPEKSVQVVAASGVSASMPRYSNLDIYNFFDYDLSSALTVTFSVRAQWRASVLRERQMQSDGTEKMVTVTPQRRLELGLPNDAYVQYRTWGVKTRTVEGQATSEDEEGTLQFTPPPPGREGREKEEQKVFLSYLRTLQRIMQDVRELDEQQRAAIAGFPTLETFPSTYQIYLWDEAQRRHLTRLMSRHFRAIVEDPALRGLAWLFPPEQVVSRPDQASRAAPVSLLSEVVDRHLAVPVPFQYTLLEVAEAIARADAAVKGLANPVTYMSSDFYREPLTNLVPGERVHEYWNTRPANAQGQGGWTKVLQNIESMNSSKTLALYRVASYLRSRNVEEVNAGRPAFMADYAAPTLHASPPAPKAMPLHSQLLHQFTLLNANLQRLEQDLTYARPMSERVDALKGAFLERRLNHGTDEYQEAVDRFQTTAGITLPDRPTVLIYSLSQNSLDFKVKVGDRDLALSPRSHPQFLDQQVKAVVRNVTDYYPEYVRKDGTKGPPREASLKLTDKVIRLADVTVLALDRENGWIALDAGGDSRILQLEQREGLDFSRHVMLDPVERDYFTSKLTLTLQGLGSPDVTALPGIVDALYVSAGTGKVTVKPSHDFVFFPLQTHQQPLVWNEAEILTPLLKQFAREGRSLNESQTQALRDSMQQRLTVLWGPPGTGKSETVRASIRATILQAQQAGFRLRVLISASTYNAVDTVLLELAEQLLVTPEGQGVQLFRLTTESRAHENIGHLTNLREIPVVTNAPSSSLEALRTALTSDSTDILVVGSISHQLHNFALASDKKLSEGQKQKATQQPWFDLLIIDEASQMDVASSTLIFSKAAPGARALVAGDHLQLAPIHQAEPPAGLENQVGSIYDYLVKGHGIEPSKLLVNYRSNSSIVKFALRAGYPPALAAHSPDLSLNLSTPVPMTVPEVWPSSLTFDPVLNQLLDPAYPLVSLVYDDDTSGQSNLFEAGVAAGLIAQLAGRLAPPLNAVGLLSQVGAEPYSLEDVFRTGVGVVAPHRAQGSLVVTQLGQLFRSPGPGLPGVSMGQLRSAVDTVERFQGGQRDVIIASFGLGDPDLIASEDEFLYGLERFNVMVSRARVKVIVMLSRSVLHYLSDDQKVARASRLLKAFVHQGCNESRTATLEYRDDDGTPVQRHAELRLGR